MAAVSKKQTDAPVRRNSDPHAPRPVAPTTLAPSAVPRRRASTCASRPQQSREGSRKNSRCQSKDVPGRLGSVGAQASAEQIKVFASYLDSVEVFASVPRAKKLEIAHVLRQRDHEQGEGIVTQGDVGDKFYILIAGSVSVLKNGFEVNTLEGSAEVPVFFGERALLNFDVRGASIVVTSTVAKTLSLDKASFNMLLRDSLAGPRRVAQAVTRRLLEDSRERHVLRGSYQARLQDAGERPRELLSVIRVEVFNDVLASVRASRLARVSVQLFLECSAAARRRRDALMRRWRCVSHCIGRICVLHQRVRANILAAAQKLAADNAWMDLQTSMAHVTTGSASVTAEGGGASAGVASLGLGCMAQKSIGLGSRALRSMGLGSRRHSEGEGESQAVPLAGGNVAAALRSARRSFAAVAKISRRRASAPLKDAK